MATAPETVRTDVDSLVELIKQKKEVSFEDAAKELGIPLATIEAWANFLEEERIVQVKYHFTTPFFVFVDSHRTKSTDDLLAEITALIRQTQDHVRDMNFDAAREKHEMIHERLQSLPPSFVDHHQLVVHELEDLHHLLDAAINNFYVGTKGFDNSLDTFTAHTLEFSRKIADLARLAKEGASTSPTAPVAEHGTEEILKELFALIQSNNFVDAVRQFPELFGKIEDSRIRAAKALGQDDFLREGMDAARKLFEGSSAALEKNDIRQAKVGFLGLHDALHTLFHQAEAVVKGEKTVLADLKLSDDSDAALKAAYDQIKAGNIEDAKRIYAKLEERYVTLPGEFLEKKDRLKHDLVRLNRDLALNIGEQSAKEIVLKANEVYRLIRLAEQQLKSYDLVGATATYKQIETLYYGLPSGFLRQKTVMQKKILDLEERIIISKRSLFLKDFGQKAQNAEKILGELKNALGRKDLASASKIYLEVKSVFGSLPPGFLEEKTALQNRILDLHRDLLNLETKTMRERMDAIDIESKGLLKQVEDKVHKGDIDGANAIYDKIEQLYREIPDGFLRRKSEIQDRIIHICEGLAEKLDSIADAEFKRKTGKIHRQLKEIRKYIQADQHDLAGAVYEEIVRVYNEMPAGFLQRKNVLRTEILTVYKDIMQSHDSLLLERVDPATKLKYDELLKLLVLIHEHIDDHEFGALMSDYSKIAKIYHSLPLGFVQENPKIREEILVVFRKLRLHQLTTKLEGFAQEGKWSELKSHLGYIFSLYRDLSKANSEDIELYRFVEERYHRFLDIFEKRTIPPPPPPSPKIVPEILKQKMRQAQSRLAAIDRVGDLAIHATPQPSTLPNIHVHSILPQSATQLKPTSVSDIATNAVPPKKIEKAPSEHSIPPSENWPELPLKPEIILQGMSAPSPLPVKPLEMPRKPATTFPRQSPTPAPRAPSQSPSSISSRPTSSSSAPRQPPAPQKILPTAQPSEPSQPPVRQNPASLPRQSTTPPPSQSAVRHDTNDLSLPPPPPPPPHLKVR